MKDEEGDPFIAQLIANVQAILPLTKPLLSLYIYNKLLASNNLLFDYKKK